MYNVLMAMNSDAVKNAIVQTIAAPYALKARHG